MSLSEVTCSKYVQTSLSLELIVVSVKGFSLLRFYLLTGFTDKKIHVKCNLRIFSELNRISSELLSYYTLILKLRRAII